MTTEPTTTTAQDMTRFLSDPSVVLDAAAADPRWAVDPDGCLDRALVAHGYGDEARAAIRDGAKHMDKMADELLSALGL